MIEILRGPLPRSIRDIKITDGSISDCLQILIHKFHLMRKQRFCKSSVSRPTIVKHAKDFRLKHRHHLTVRHGNITLDSLHASHNILRLNVTYRQKQRPQTVLITFQILKRDSLIDPLMDFLSCHQPFNLVLTLYRISPDNISYQLIAARIHPITDQFPLAHIITDRPRIINILMPTDRKPIIHCLHILDGINILTLKRIHHFLLRKSETITVRITSNRIHFQIIKIREQRVLGNSRYPGNNCTIKEIILLKRCVEQLTKRIDRLIPIPIRISLQKRCIIFIHQNNWKLSIMLIQQLTQFLNRDLHIFRPLLREIGDNTTIFRLFLLAQLRTLPQIFMLNIHIV